MSEQNATESHNPFDLSNTRRLLEPWTELSSTLTDHAVKAQQRAISQYHELSKEGLGLIGDGMEIWTKAVKRCGEISQEQIKRAQELWRAEA